MGSMFGGFGGFPGGGQARLGQTGVVTSVAPAGSTLFGGFPGVFPGMGPGQSGAAGILEMQQALQRCIREGRCPVVYGPPAGWL